MRDYPNRRDQTPHLGRIRMLQDTDGDGLYDSSTIYADDLSAPSAVFCYGGGVFVAAAPEILFFKDVNKNGWQMCAGSCFQVSASLAQTSRGQVCRTASRGTGHRIHGAAGEFGGKIVASAGAEPLILGNNGFLSIRYRQLVVEAGAADSGCTFDSRGRKFICDPAHPLRTVMYRISDAARNTYSAIPLPVAECAVPPRRSIDLPPARLMRRVP